jgi:hypothetical protein
VITPKRWLDERSEADDFERAILRSAELGAVPPLGAEREVLERVMAVVAPVGPLGPGPSGGAAGPAAGGAAAGGALAKSAATLGGLGKGFALGLGVSIAATTGSHFLDPSRSRDPVSSVSVPFPSVAPAVAIPRPARGVEAPSVALTAEPSLEKAPQAAVEPSPRVGAPFAVPPASPASSPLPEQAPGAPSVASFPSDDAALAASRLMEEAALLRRARSELRAGALAAAFATLEASRRAFSAPELVQEREALAIELLYRSGERAAAGARARDFLARFPGSPHAASVRAFADDARR